jgi:hypothetical protein
MPVRLVKKITSNVTSPRPDGAQQDGWIVPWIWGFAPEKIASEKIAVGGGHQSGRNAEREVVRRWQRRRSRPIIVIYASKNRIDPPAQIDGACVFRFTTL